MYADASSIARDLGYTAAVDLRDGLRRTIAAYRAHALSGKPAAQRAAP
jgi:nucleoside-diphosphate-sugar epimerase